ncbi:DUF3180 domain-containing protein [Microlunatus parietis]|uniref:DUF3180 domain-containing protein n=1 Tax=Microlunatus parietis TaxID=682979 RepID=A0A7Y9LDR8_9ACTN|nr:DUF3180 domain-containing protein [Microlunatus parietis]NYE73080.1 hypothetical protein [Microlunatus parietis]
MAEPTDDGSLKTTPPLALAVAALFGGLAGWLVVVGARALNISPPQVPWSAPIAMIVVAVAIGLLAWQTYQRIHRRRLRIDPQRAVSFLVLGKASALAGALVAGGYLAYAFMFVAQIAGDSPRERVVRSLVAVLGGLALGTAGLLLERACKVPDDPDSESDSRPEDDPADRDR